MAGQARASTSASASSSTAPTFASALTASPPLPPVRHSSSARTLRHDPYYEPPSTPPNKHRRPLANSQRGDSRGREGGGGSAAAVRNGAYEPRASTSSNKRRDLQYDQEPHITARGDPRHSHGLSLSSNTRDSLVDNLLMSLDGLSQLANHNIDDLVRERERQAQWERHDALSAMALPLARPRGHTYSSSMSSDRHVRDSPGSAMSSLVQHQQHHQTSRPSVDSTNLDGSNSNSNGRTRPRKSSATDSQRDGFARTHAHAHARDYSIASSTDNGYATALETPKLALGGVRSISLDHIHRTASYHNNAHHQQQLADSVLSRGRPVPSVYSRYESSFDAAPEPMVPAGPRKLQNPNATGPVYVNAASKATSSLRKITTQSDLRAASSTNVPSDIREKATNFVRASSMRDTNNMALAADRSLAAPPMPALRKDAQSPPRTEKPGFFKRVFGGGKTTPNDRQDALQTRPGSVTHDSSQSVLPPKPESRHASADHSLVSSQSQSQPQLQPQPPPLPPQLNKKPSSFFRRRKKSTSEVEKPPPPPLPFQPADADKTQTPAHPRASVSSLRKVMDPYLSETSASANGGDGAKARTNAERPMTSASLVSDDDLDIFHSGYTPPADAALSKSMVNLNSQENDSPRMKIKSRKHIAAEQRTVSTSHSQSHPSDSSAAPFDSVFRDRPAISHIKINGNASDVEPPKVSPLSDMVPSHPVDSSRGGAGGDTSADEPTSEMRAFAAGNNVDLNLGSDSWLAAHDKSMFESIESRPSTNLDSHTSDSFPALRPNAAWTVSSQPADADDEGQSTTEHKEKARRIFDGDESGVSKMDAASWLGATKNIRTLHEYMQLYDFSHMNILTALRALCGKLLLRGETQQFDRIITALSARWCESNPNHGFKAQDVVHTLCYSLILLNTDLHMADIGEKMSRSAYVKNTLPTIRRVVVDAAPNAFDETAKLAPREPARSSIPWMDNSAPTSPAFPPDTPQERTSFDSGRPAPTLSKRNSVRPGPFRNDSEGVSAEVMGSNSLVNAPMNSSMRAWESEVEVILKSFFTSIKAEPLPLLALTLPNQGAMSSSSNLMPPDRAGSAAESSLHRNASVISRAPSDNGAPRSRGLRSLTLGWQARNNRSRQKVFMTNTMASSRTSFDDSNSVWSPTQSSTWSKNSMGKTLTSSSMNSLAASYMGGDREFKHSIGFANALSHAIIREEVGNMMGPDAESFTIRGDLLDDESLTLEGAPWAKEGMLKHKHHLEGPERKAKERSWKECFAVISRGKITLFNFNTDVKSRSLGRPRTKHGQQTPSIAGSRVGGGDWMENAEQLGVFVLRHTISTTLPPPGYSKTRPFVWALSLPSGAVHLFQVGTPEIALEWMTTANYWSARLSKEPLAGGVSNIEYGWSEAVINTAVLDKSASFSTPPSSMLNKPHGHSHSASQSTVPVRQSLNSSIRGSFDIGGGSRQRLPGDKVQITEWTPPSQSVMASQLSETEQIRALTTYVVNVELELERHHELKQAIELAYSPRHANYGRAMSNWQRKSEYLLREAVKFRTYMDSLTAAQTQKEEVYTRRAERSGKSPTSAKFPAAAAAAPNNTLSPDASTRDLTRTTSNISASTVSLHAGEHLPAAS